MPVLKGRILRNFSYLMIIQVMNVLFPLITFPFLLDDLGISLLSEVVLAQSIMTYSSVLVNFGFNYIGVADVSRNRHDVNTCAKIIRDISFSKLLCLFLLLCVMLILFNVLPFFEGRKYLYLLFLYLPLSEIFFPIYYFQGIEKMGVISVFNFINKGLVAIGSIFFVNDPEDYLLVPLTGWIALLISLFFLLKIMAQHGLKFRFSGAVSFRYYFKESYVMGAAMIINNVKFNLPMLLINIVGMKGIIPFYDIAQKIVNAFFTLFDTLSISIFPQTVLKNHQLNIRGLAKWSFILTFIGSVSFIVLFLLFRHSLLSWKYYTVLEVLAWLVLSIPFYCVASILGRNVLYVNSLSIVLLKSMFWSSVLFVAIPLISAKLLLINSWQIMSFAFVLSLIFESFVRYFYVYKNQLL